jgi:hypothetical protein
VIANASKMAALNEKILVSFASVFMDVTLAMNNYVP